MLLPMIGFYKRQNFMNVLAHFTDTVDQSKICSLLLLAAFFKHSGELEDLV